METGWHTLIDAGIMKLHSAIFDHGMWNFVCSPMFHHISSSLIDFLGFKSTKAGFQSYLQTLLCPDIDHSWLCVHFESVIYQRIHI